MMISKQMKMNNNTSKIAFCIATIILLVTFVPRFIDIHYELPYYSIDENEVVEMAVSFMGGDFNYRFYKYGPLTSYILSIIYYGVYLGERLFSDVTLNSFVQRIFFEKRTLFYFIARLLNVFFNLLFILLVFKYCLRFFNSWTLWLAVGLAALPLGELLSNFWIRVDTLQALCAFTSFYFIMSYYDINRHRADSKKNDWKKDKAFKNLIFSGLFAGFSVAAKPIPGSIIIPVIVFIFILSSKKISPLYFFALMAVIFLGNFIGNPYSILNISKFINYNLSSITGEAKRSFLVGYNITRFAKNWGWPLTLAFSSFIIGVFQKKDKILRLTCIFPILYFSVFALVPARNYFYIALVPYLAIVIARVVVLGCEKYLRDKSPAKQIVMISVGIILAVFPVYKSIAKSVYYRSYNEYCCAAAGRWIKENIPSKSSFLFYGFYTNLPFLIDFDISYHANLAEYFMYHRRENEWWVDQYIQAFEKKIQAGCPTYRIRKIRQNYQSDKELTNFLIYCKKKKIQYVVLNSHEHQSWERRAWLLIAFNEDNGYRGGNVRIYKII